MMFAEQLNRASEQQCIRVAARSPSVNRSIRGGKCRIDAAFSSVGRYGSLTFSNK